MLFLNSNKDINQTAKRGVIRSINSNSKTLGIHSYDNTNFFYRTQMGIPVPSRRSDKGLASASSKLVSRNPRGHGKAREDAAIEIESDSGMPPSNHVEELRRPADVTRMGNYFNIVIAPPPIKALQPRKLLQNDPFRQPSKRI